MFYSFFISCALLFFFIKPLNAQQQEYAYGGGNYPTSSVPPSTNGPQALPPTQGYCPPGEVMLNCSMAPGCEPTCDQPQPSQYCRQICPVARCHCVLGYVRSPFGNCIPFDQCPSPSCANQPQCDPKVGLNSRGECRCRCGVNERCQRVRNSTEQGDDCGCHNCGEEMPRSDDEQWECVPVLMCGENDCVPGQERCRVSTKTFEPQCVPINGSSSSVGPYMPTTKSSTPKASTSMPSSTTSKAQSSSTQSASSSTPSSSTKSSSQRPSSSSVRPSSTSALPSSTTTQAGMPNEWAGFWEWLSKCFGADKNDKY